MHIIKGQTRAFNDYEVVLVTRENLPQTWLQWLKKEQPTEEVENILQGVVEADDATGLLVQQITDFEGKPVFTNGIEDILLDNPVKVLLLLPNIRQAFHAAGFRPKLARTYENKLKIRYLGPAQTTIVTTEPSTALETTEIASER